jgi:hypothetical protein
MSFHILPVGRLGNIMFSFYIFTILQDKYPNHKIYIYDNYIKHYYKKDYDKILETFPVIKDFIIKSVGDVESFHLRRRELKKICNIIQTSVLNIENFKITDNVFFNGVFSNSNNYLKHRKLLQEKLFFNLNDIFDGITVHLRSGDCWGDYTNKLHAGPKLLNKNIKYGGGTNYAWQPIPMISFYRKILDNKKKIRFVVEQKDDPILLKLLEIYKDKEIIVQSEDFITDFLTLMNSKEIVLSISTFSWNAVFLGNAVNIYMPGGGLFNKNCPRRGSSICFDLNIPGVRYYTLNNPIYLDKWRGSLSDLNYILNN